MSDISDDGLSQDTLFTLLSNPRRRFVLQYLARTKETISLQELATKVAAWENETDPENLSDKQQKRLYVSLYQTHVPKLEDVGIIDYDSDTGEIRLTDRAQDFEPYLQDGTGHRVEGHHWDRYYILLSLAGVLTYGLFIVSGIPVDRADVFLFGLGWMLLLATLAVFHYIDNRHGNKV